ncbi:hypothetical protein M2324_001822 [Rhodovulum sulfidophilum]|uniref:hypothetical protein n=1 Tax=Rhodovulum sulfidophilum TaxID=35806 RepID=UPI0005A7E3DB|nr:hypothetical protein [Rhodovulum sulfidophilum]MCW2303425.1 hypothetical protein [Rhodovulum sulfidophilum]
MPLNPDTLILPEETEILLSALKLTDGKVEQLLPLTEIVPGGEAQSFLGLASPHDPERTPFPETPAPGP